MKQIVTAAEARNSVARVQDLADKGLAECQICKKEKKLPDCLTCWKDGVLVFTICTVCMGTHQIVMEPTNEGYRIHGREHHPVSISTP